MNLNKLLESRGPTPGLNGAGRGSILSRRINTRARPIQCCPCSTVASQTRDLSRNVGKENAGNRKNVKPEAPTIFFTGKPYVDGLGYVFKYRNYNPELCRWQSADPSGFPDGANNQIYAPVPTSQFDPTGLDVQQFYSGNILFNLTYTLSYSYTSSPTLITANLGGFTTIPGFPVGYNITMSSPSISVVSTTFTQDSAGNNIVVYAGDFYANLTLTSTLGISFGSFNLGYPYTQNLLVTDPWGVTAYE